MSNVEIDNENPRVKTLIGIFSDLLREGLPGTRDGEMDPSIKIYQTLEEIERKDAEWSQQMTGTFRSLSHFVSFHMTLKLYRELTEATQLKLNPEKTMQIRDVFLTREDMRNVLGVLNYRSPGNGIIM